MHQNQIGEPFATGCQLGEMVRKGGELTYKCSGIELLNVSKSIRSYLLSKQIAISAEHLTSALNVHADWESRNAKGNSEWKLDVSVF